jgi:hypothetical protein
MCDDFLKGKYDILYNGVLALLDLASSFKWIRAEVALDLIIYVCFKNGTREIC